MALMVSSPARVGIGPNRPLASVVAESTRAPSTGSPAALTTVPLMSAPTGRRNRVDARTTCLPGSARMLDDAGR